jgi:hypothetical protein
MPASPYHRDRDLGLTGFLLPAPSHQAHPARPVAKWGGAAGITAQTTHRRMNRRFDFSANQSTVPVAFPALGVNLLSNHVHQWVG